MIIFYKTALLATKIDATFWGYFMKNSPKTNKGLCFFRRNNGLCWLTVGFTKSCGIKLPEILNHS